jgi:Carboxypeptidase regulatory-like domain/TonB-dependent Receptor Plug Domain/TonB dependent receptor-like, beta-barrel
MRTPLLFALGLLTAASLLQPCSARAQATGTIAGIVTDESGAVLPGVTIEITNSSTNQTRTAATGGDGYYTVPLLQPGVYTVKATLPAFRTTLREKVAVTVDTTSRVDLRLAVAAVQETVTIVEPPRLVETSESTLGIVMEGKQIVELPLNGRNFTQLGTLLPGVVAPPAALGGAAGDATPGGFGAATSGFSVNGMRNQSNNFLLDGASNNDTFNTGFITRPPPDAIQEFKILTHAYSAEYGRNAGSVVNVVTRGGSNEVHGAAWEFNRDDSLQARNFFAPATQPKPKLKQNQFGGSLGGPLVRNRLFGFGYFDGHRNTSGTTTNIVVLSDAQRAGNFAGGPAIRDPQTGAPFPGNVIPADRQDRAAVKLIEDFVPRANSGTNRYVVSPDSRDERNQLGTRIDFQMTPTNTILGRYLRTTTDIESPPTTRPIGSVARATLQDWMVSDTYIVSGTAVNVARFSFSKIAAHPAVTSGLQNTDYFINVPHNVPAAQGLANIGITGFFSLGDAQQPFVDRVNEVVQFTDDFNWTTGNHFLKFGFDMRREHMVIAFVNRPNGDFTFTGSPTDRTGNAAADFLLGLPSQFRRTTSNSIQDGTGWLYAGYLQDDFRPWPHFTINAGLRYELPLPFVDKHDALNSFRPGQQSTRFPQAPNGLVYPGDAGVPRGTYATDKNNVSPRTGIVWDPTGTGSSALRGSWGTFYDALAGQGDFFQNGVLAPPFTPLLEVNAPPAALTLRDPMNAVAAGPVGFPPGLTFIGWGTDFTTPYAHHFNVTWQQQFWQRLAGEVGYVGSRGFHLPIFMEVNPGLYAPGQTTAGARLFPAFALVRPTFSVAKSWYDSLQASLRMPPTKGMGFLVSYTLGHARDHVSGLNIGGEQRPVLPVTIGDEASIDRALGFEKGDALFDVRHRFVASFTAEVPSMKSAGRLVNAIVAGWQLNGIIQTQSGYPTTVFDPALSIRYLTNRPDQVCDPIDNAPHSVEQWFNVSCFVQRPLAQTAEPGSTPRNSVRGPGFTRTDLSLFKNIRLLPTHTLQLRVEAFNLFNQARFGQPGNQIGTPTFGRITAAEDGRVIQLAVKYNF